MSTQYDSVVIGGGFYGCRLALFLRKLGHRVLLAEREATLIGRASLRNQARVHNGYHYPRSILTSLRSRLNYARFLEEYAECVDLSFPHYYAISRQMSKITAAQFVAFCRRIEAPIAPAPDVVTKLFDASRIESVFEVQECAFDALKLRARVERDLSAAGVDVRLETDVARCEMHGDSQHGGATVSLSRRGFEETVSADFVLNCTYSGLNQVLVNAGASVIPVKHELTEMALVEPPAELGGAAVTVMDGPFFSLMPYPSRGLFTLSHVRYTPHCNWTDGERRESPGPRESRFAHMIHDAQRYLPVMRSARYVDSLWETKTLMPRSERDDSRPILVRRSADHRQLVTILGAKIDSVYDAEDALRALLAPPPAPVSSVPRPTPIDVRRIPDFDRRTAGSR